ncbi:class I SAM-dependent methyltransferase [Aquihabitans sp. G128]|uniref:class I SAM-dependent DNA methyltransferase n=1 Tax=Aquihabitans sp. G128 TaxID=2849779 RepID=UPI001C21254D|nr:class I SAM-dependent methyltransferase [Aquihabitans sp. G128]QXC63123.1 class I SAM-dependent methyltransferase [Aquihabitans sp. G128]
MEGYDEATYGDRFADVYDDWYGTITDTDACVAALAALADAAGGGPVLELGVGTGRLAVPLAQRGATVVGIDASQAMLDRLARNLAAAEPPVPDGAGVRGVLGDMAHPPLDSQRFGLAFVAYNTLFNLIGPGAQQRCFGAVAAALEPAGRFVVEVFVPDPEAGPGDAVAPRRVTADRVVLSVSRNDPSSQEVLGQYVDITEAGIKLRPWHIRWATPAQLDAMAAAAGLVVEQRWSDWEGTPAGPEAATHVTTYRRA